MTAKRFPLRTIIGGVVIVSFVVLLAIRMEIISLSGGGEKNMLSHRAVETPLSGQPASKKETWMNIYQQGHKIGYAHRIVSGQEQGYKIREEVLMQVQTMGVVQGISLQTEGILNADMSLARFDFDLKSNLFSFQAHGKVDQDRLSIFTKAGDNEQRYELPMKGPVHLSQGILARAQQEDLAPGGELAVSVFDPASMGSRPVLLRFLGEENLSIMGRRETLRKYSVDFMGARQYAWLDREGEVVREEGILGMALEKTSPEDARSGAALGKSADLTDLAAVDPQVQIDNPQDLKMLTVKIYNIDAGGLMLDGGRQSYEQGLLTIRKEVRGKPGGELKNRAPYLASTPFVQASHPAVRTQAAAIVSLNDGDEEKIRKIVAWVHKNISKRPVLSVSNALETLKNRTGDCTEHSVLVAALARAEGIPMVIETGLVYQRGRFYYHAWNACWLDSWGGWVTVDAVMNQFPADVTHLRFVKGDMEKQLDLMGVMGRINIRVEGMSR